MSVESHGVDAVPTSARDRGWFTIFAMFAGVNICLPMMLVGGILVPGLSFSQAILVGLLGNLIAGVVVVLAAYPGSDHGLPASVLTRISLGFPRGTWIASLAMAFSSVGWFAVQAELAGLAANGLMERMLGASSPTVTIALMGAMNVLFAVMGFRWIEKLASFAVPALLVVAIALFYQIAQQHPFRELVSRPGNGSLTFLAGLNIMISGQIGGAFTASDLSRYARSTNAVWTGVLAGMAPISAFMISLGALSALASGEWNPVVGVQEIGLGLPALLLIIFATWTTNDKNLYSGGLALTNVFPHQPRWRLTLLLGAAGTVLGCVRLTNYFTTWLVTLGAVFAPFVGILLADYFVLRRRAPLIDDIYRKDGRYGYSSGVNIAALVAIALGVIAGRLAPPEAIQPLVSLVVTGLCYVSAMRVLHPAHVRGTAQ